MKLKAILLTILLALRIQQIFASPSFVQQNYTYFASSAAAVTVRPSAVQTSGDANIVLVTAATNLRSVEFAYMTASPGPSPFPDNTVVNVSGGGNALDTAVAAHSGQNVTFNIAAGHYGTNGIPIQSGCQYIGAGAGSTIIKANGSNGVFFGAGDNGNNSVIFNNVQIRNLTIDANITGYGISFTGNNILIDSIVDQDYAAPKSGIEHFEIYLIATAENLPPRGTINNQVISNSMFTPATSGNNDGTSVIVIGAGPVNGWSYTNCDVLNCKFNPPTDSGTAYYHCVGNCSLVQGCTANLNTSIGYGAFFYAEPGSYDGLNSTPQDNTEKMVVQNNTITLGANYSGFWFAYHSNGWFSGTLTINGNTIDQGTGTGGDVFEMTIINGSSFNNPALGDLVITNNLYPSSRTLISVQSGLSIGSTTNTGNTTH